MKYESETATYEKIIKKQENCRELLTYHWHKCIIYSTSERFVLVDKNVRFGCAYSEKTF